MDRLEKPDNSSLELLRNVLKGVLTLEQSKSKQTFANLKNGLKKAEAQKLIPRGMQELVRKETSHLLNEVKENVMSKNNYIDDDAIIMAEDLVVYLENHEGFSEHDFAELFCKGDVVQAEKLRENPSIHVVGTVNMPEKVFDDNVDFRGLIFSKLICTETCFDNGFYVENVKSELRLGKAFYSELVAIKNITGNVFFESADFEDACVVVEHFQINDQRSVAEINFGSAKFYSVTGNHCHCSIDFGSARFYSVEFENSLIFEIKHGDMVSVDSSLKLSKIVADEVILGENFGCEGISTYVLDHVTKFHSCERPGTKGMYVSGSCKEVILEPYETYDDEIVEFSSGKFGTIRLRSASKIKFRNSVNVEESIVFEGESFKPIAVEDGFTCIMNFPNPSYANWGDLLQFYLTQKKKGDLIIFRKNDGPLFLNKKQPESKYVKSSEDSLTTDLDSDSFNTRFYQYGYALWSEGNGINAKTFANHKFMIKYNFELTPVFCSSCGKQLEDWQHIANIDFNIEEISYVGDDVIDWLNRLDHIDYSIDCDELEITIDSAGKPILSWKEGELFEELSDKFESCVNTADRPWSQDPTSAMCWQCAEKYERQEE